MQTETGSVTNEAKEQTKEAADFDCAYSLFHCRILYLRTDSRYIGTMLFNFISLIYLFIVVPDLLQRKIWKCIFIQFQILEKLTCF